MAIARRAELLALGLVDVTAAEIEARYPDTKPFFSYVDDDGTRRFMELPEGVASLPPRHPDHCGLIWNDERKEFVWQKQPDGSFVPIDHDKP